MSLHLPQEDFQRKKILIYADICQLRKVFRNLLSNAIRFTSRGGCIDVNLNHFLTKESLSRISIDIVDSGAGILKVLLELLL